MTRIYTEPQHLPNITEFPETMRGGTWDRQTYAGSAEHALELATALADSHRFALRAPGVSPRWTSARVQVWYDGWRHAWRVLRYMGACVVCGRRTYNFDDGENDPRGVLGDRAAQNVTHEDVDTLKENEYVPACFACMNEEPKYREALEIARRAARRMVTA